MKIKKITTILFFVSGMFFLCAGIALAQTQQKKNKSTQIASKSGQPINQSAQDVAKSRDRARVLLDKIDVVGSLAKPQAIFIIPGSDPKVDGISIDRSFFMEIFRPVEKDFFPQKGRRKFRGAIPW